MDYELNEHGVFMTPKIVFISSCGKLAWDFTRITISEIKCTWYYGLWLPGGCSPCSKFGKAFDTENEVIEVAYVELKERLEDEQRMDTGFNHSGKKHLKELIEWWGTKNQLTIF